MNSTTIHESDRVALRTAIERIIARYPDISENELHQVLGYFRREASAADRAMIASNPDIHDNYRRFRQDQRLDRLGMVELSAVAVFVLLLALAIVFFTFGGWEL